MKKTILIAGGTGGIGNAVAKIFSENDFKVIVWGRDEEKFKGFNFNDNVVFRKIEEFNFEFDFFVNCIGAGFYERIVNFSKESLRKSYEANFEIPLILIKRVSQYFMKKKSGWIININSAAGLEGYVEGSLYSSFKFAQRGLFEVLEKEIRGKGIKITEIFPGIVETPLLDKMKKIPKKECLISPQKIGSLILHFIKEDLYLRRVEISNPSLKWN